MGIQILNKDVSIITNVMGKPKASIGNIFGKTGWVGGVSAPYVITAPTLSETFICARPSLIVTIQNMVWGGTPTPVITYSWMQVNFGGPDFAIGQYTNTLYLDYSYAETYLYCVITATNSAGVTTVNTPQVYAYDCS